jgi:hypothetical protein
MKYQLNDSRVLELDDELGAISEFPAFIEVQTASYCNSSCIVCPYTKVKPYVPMGKMKRQLWDKLIDEFAMNRAILKILNLTLTMNLF